MNLTELYRQKQQERLEQMVKDKYPGTDCEKFQEALRNLANSVVEAMKPIMDAIQRFADGVSNTVERVFGPIREFITKTFKLDFTRGYTEPIIDKRQQLHRFKFNKV